MRWKRFLCKLRILTSVVVLTASCPGSYILSLRLASHATSLARYIEALGFYELSAAMNTIAP